VYFLKDQKEDQKDLTFALICKRLDGKVAVERLKMDIVFGEQSNDWMERAID